MNNNMDKNNEIDINEERIQNLLKLRKKNLYKKLFRARLRKFDYSNLTKKNESLNIIPYNKNIGANNEELFFKEEDYLIDPDDLEINETIKKMDFVKTENIINNIAVLLNDSKNINSILYGLLMMRKFTVIDAVLINKSEYFIENKLYI
jgi:hypothetical protein